MKRTKKLGDHSAVSYPLSKPLSYLTPQVLGASSHPFAVCQTSMPTHHPQPPLHPPPLLMKITDYISSLFLGLVSISKNENAHGMGLGGSCEPWF